jgi:hypothetical protein
MKIHSVIVLVLGIIGYLDGKPVIGSASVTLMGEFVIKDKPGELLPPFTLYFDGNLVTSDTSGAYTITISPEDVAAGRLDDFSLMICKRIGLDYEQGHTLAGMKLKKLEKCVWYKLDREWDEGRKKHYWKIEQQEIKDTDCVPEKCLLVLMSSQYVDSVQDTAHLALNADRIDGVLPTIVLKDEPVVLQRASTKCAIESIDMRQHTAPQRVQTLTQNGVVCALHGG